MADLPVWPPYYSDVETEGNAQLTPTNLGAGMVAKTIVVDVPLSGASVATSTVIPDVSTVLGVNTKVLETVTGATSFNVGYAGTPAAWSSNVGVAAGTRSPGAPYSPVTFTWGGPVAVLLTAVGGNFTSGTVRLAIHCITMIPPT